MTLARSDPDPRRRPRRRAPPASAGSRIHGFKTFADLMALDILHGLTGLIGPNGCGESNVVDALRSAMGEGSFPALFADLTTVQVTRRIKRGAGSVYQVNSRDARARDVQALFTDIAGGARSFAMVGQGRMDALVQDVVQIRVTPKTSSSSYRQSLLISGVAWRWHFWTVPPKLRLQAAPG